ncbi:hypothetical protein TNCV_917321 [Trichonephila clavipes]|nr:hypothetical protein TNCV_917321 [Trichonephila clavipes]
MVLLLLSVNNYLLDALYSHSSPIPSDIVERIWPNNKQFGPWVAWWLEHRTPDRKAWARCPMPPNILRFNAETVEVEINGVALYRPFGEFHRAKSYCHLYGAEGQRQAYLLPIPR